MGRLIPRDPILPLVEIRNLNDNNNNNNNNNNVNITSNRFTFSPPISREAIRSESATTRRFTPAIIGNSNSSNALESIVPPQIRSLSEESRRELHRRIREQRELLLFGVISNHPDRLESSRGLNQNEIVETDEVRPIISRRLSVGSNMIRNEETEITLSSARNALRNAVGFAERLEQVTRSLTSLADNVSPSSTNNNNLPLESTTLSLSTSSTLQRSLEQLRQASARIDRILTEERARANDLTTSRNTGFSSPAIPPRTTSETIQQLRETTSALLISLPSLSSSPVVTSEELEPTTTSTLSTPTLIRTPIVETSRPNPSNPLTTWTLADSQVGLSRRRAVYHIVVAREDENRPTPYIPSTPSTPATDGNNMSAESEGEESADLLRGWGMLDRNGDQILTDVVETGVEVTVVERGAR